MNSTRVGLSLILLLAGAVLATAQGTAQNRPDPRPAQSIAQEPGILIGAVLPDSPAAKAGIKRGDILLNFDGKAVNHAGDLRQLLGSYKAGQDVKVGLSRGKDQITVSLKLEDRIGKPIVGIVEAQAGGPGDRGMRGEPGQRGERGAPKHAFMPPEVQELAKGSVVITEVQAGSPADKAGLKKGDLVSQIDGQSLDGDLAGKIGAKKSGDTVNLSVLHRGDFKPLLDTPPAAPKPNTVSVTLGAKDGKTWLGVAYAPTGQMIRDRLAPRLEQMRERMPAPHGEQAM